MNILNDTEHRIFLSAMAREKEICQKIDGDKIYDSTVKMLVPVCESIERKVDRAILIPEGATNGDMIKAMLQVVGYTPLSTWAEEKRKKSGFHVHIQGEFKTDFRLTVSEDWWNAPYKGGRK